jgi:alkylhydroperoxidase/carboxymuconolactone decarboxylase family protein YurZ
VPFLSTGSDQAIDRHSWGFERFVFREVVVKLRKKILDYDYEEVMDSKTRELVRVGCAVAVGCPT